MANNDIKVVIVVVYKWFVQKLKTYWQARRSLPKPLYKGITVWTKLARLFRLETKPARRLRCRLWPAPAAAPTRVRHHLPAFALKFALRRACVRCLCR